MTRDNQRTACYNWERSLRTQYPQPNIELVGAIALVDLISHDYGIRAPVVTDGRGRRSACYSPRMHAIKLPRWARTKFVVCHEMAHAIAGQAGGWHGPRFARTLLILWTRYAGINGDAAYTLGAAQRPRRVNFI
jgi:hypothetical protein